MIRSLVGGGVVAGIILVLALGSQGSGSWPTALSAFSGDKRAAYRTAAVTRGRIRDTISATGSLRALSTVDVSSQLSGQVARMHVDFNDPVQAGQRLAELDQRGFQARVQQAQAELAMVRQKVALLAAKLEKARGVAAEELARRKVYQARIDKARVELEAAKRRQARIQKLNRSGGASRSSAEDAQLELDKAAVALRETEAQSEAHEHVLAASRAGRLEAQAELATARAELPLRQAALELARLDLERSTIRAPIDGVLVGRNVERGQTVAASFDAPTLFTIAGDLTEMEIHANIDETDIGDIEVGQSAEFSVDAFPERSFPAEVKEIRQSARVVEGVVVYTVVLRASNPERMLLPGMTATVRIVTDEVGPLPLLPVSALSFSPYESGADGEGSGMNGRKGRWTVWVLDPQQMPQPRRAKLGPDDGRRVAVLDGDLAVGERVITGRRVPRDDQRLFGIRF